MTAGLPIIEDVGASDSAALNAHREANELLRKPVFAIVIPVYKHPVFVSEAIGSALTEARLSNGVVVIVNDGCPLLETHEVCSTFANGYPEAIDYLRTENGGLSAARNRGIRHALASYPSIQAIYLLDADNRLGRGAIRRALTTLRETGADWVYPNIDKFGIEWSGDYSPRYSLFRHLFNNICEAGSLIHRRIFEAGIAFDESMKQGYEDWEFWLSCADAGFRGAPCPTFGFQYRARRESMVRDSDRVEAELLAYMHKKHKRLYSWKNIIKLEHHEAPRYCVIDPAHRKYDFTSVPGETATTGSLVGIDQAYWLSDAFPAHTHFPAFIIVADQRVLDALSRACLIDWVFWQIEDMLESGSFAFVRLERDGRDISYSIENSAEKVGQLTADAHIVATTLGCIQSVVADSSSSWIDSLKAPQPSPHASVLTVKAPIEPQFFKRYGITNALSTLFDVIHQLRHSPERQADIRKWEWRDYDALVPGRDLFRRVRKHMGAQGPLGRCVLRDEKEIAFLLPLMSFGGVEQVAIQVAQQFRAAGWRTRLVITQATDIKIPSRLAEAFDIFCFLNDPRHARWNSSSLKYYGHDLQAWAVDGRHDRLIGLLAGCAAVVSFQAMQANEVMGWLRRQGVVTATSLHLIDRDQFLAPVGHPYLMLAYEHAFDLITAPSRQLINFCRAAGVPLSKLVYLQNAATFTRDARLVRKRMEDLWAAANGSPSRPLRVLSIGRLDRQKGLGRLRALVSATKEQGLSIEWRLVGSQVVADEGIASDVITAAGVLLEAPVYERGEVVERLLWADMIVLLSRWEGSPLSILEAQSLGVVPIATDVGAVRELIDDGSDGFLIKDGDVEEVVASALDCLLRFARDPNLRQLMSRCAMERVGDLTWHSTAEDFLSRISELINKR